MASIGYIVGLEFSLCYEYIILLIEDVVFCPGLLLLSNVSYPIMCLFLGLVLVLIFEGTANVMFKNS